MFENLTGKFEEIFSSLKKAPSLNEKQVDEGLRKIRQALLEADVALPVAKELIKNIKPKAIGQEIIKSTTPGQMLIKVVFDEIVKILGDTKSELNLNAVPPVCLMLVGLQGSGKTTTAAKLAKYLEKNNKKKSLMVSLDIYRPAAQEQLNILGEQNSIQTLPIVKDQRPLDIVKRALNAASLALMAIHANRETFKDNDTVRIHPIITKGGEAVNSVPADVRMETFVRASDIDAIVEANRKVDRALKAGAMAVGAKVNITTIPGYLPLKQDYSMMEIFRRNAVSLVGEEGIGYRRHGTGSTDMGDVSQIMPAIHPYVGGARGLGHGNDYIIKDYDLAVVTAAKSIATTIIDLLAEGAAGAANVLSQHRGAMTKAQYLKLMRNLANEELYTPEE